MFKKFVILCVVLGIIAGGYMVNRARLLGDSGFIASRLGDERTVLFTDGSPMGGLSESGQRRQYLQYSELPKCWVDGVVAAEDKRFWYHPGLDPLGLARAMIENAKAKRWQYGGSTISVQVAKGLFDRKSRSSHKLLAKGLEIVDGIVLDALYSKEYLLELYANLMHIRSNAYGLGVAAERFFGKRVSGLDEIECAYLAGIAKGPRDYDPWIKGAAGRKAAFKRKNYVLTRMAAEGTMPDQRAKALRSVSVPFTTTPPSNAAYKPNMQVRPVKESLKSGPVADALRTAGYSINDVGSVLTYMDKDMQEGAQAALIAQLARMGSNGRDGAIVALGPGGIMVVMVGSKDVTGMNRALGSRRSPGSTMKVAIAAAYLTLWGSPSDEFKNVPGTVFPFRNDDPPYKPQADHNPAPEDYYSISLAKALVTSENIAFVDVLYRLTQWLPPEHTVWLAEQLGMWPAADENPAAFFRNNPSLQYMDDESLAAGLAMVKAPAYGRPRYEDVRQLSVWHPDRIIWDRDFRVLLGLKYMAQFLHAAGVESPVHEGLSLVLGGSGITPLDSARLARALATGFALPPGQRDPGLAIIHKVFDKSGNEILNTEHLRSEERVIPAGVTEAIVAMEAEVFNPGGTAFSKRNAITVDGRRLPLAGKTGTAGQGRTTNFVGCVPTVSRRFGVFGGLTASVEYGSYCLAAMQGRDDNGPQPSSSRYGWWSGASAALPIWADTAFAVAQSTMGDDHVVGSGSAQGEIPLVGTSLGGSRQFQPVIYRRPAQSYSLNGIKLPSAASPQPQAAKPKVKKQDKAEADESWLDKAKAVKKAMNDWKRDWKRR